MFDIGASELLLVAMVALLVIGPKDLPVAMRTAGNWLGKLRAMTRHFRVGLDAMIREAEIEEQEKVWAEKNAKIMREHPPESEVQAPEAKPPAGPAKPDESGPSSSGDEPELSLGPPPAKPRKGEG